LQTRNRTMSFGSRQPKEWGCLVWSIITGEYTQEKKIGGRYAESKKIMQDGQTGYILFFSLGLRELDDLWPRGKGVGSSRPLSEHIT